MSANSELNTPIYIDSKMLTNLSGKHPDGQTDIELLNSFVATANEANLLLKLNGSSEATEVKAGSLVQLDGRIYPNPLLNMLDAFLQLMTISGVDVNSKSQSSTSRLYPVPASNPSQGEAAIFDIFQNLRAQLAESPFQDGLMLPVGNLLAAVTFQNQLLPAGRPDLLYIGEYQVIGKVTRVAPVGEELSLYDRTSYRHVDKEFFTSSFESLNEVPWMKLPGISTHLPGPSIQVLPLAVII